MPRFFYKKFRIVCLTLVFLYVFTSGTSLAAVWKSECVILDAGHGAPDGGAVGSGGLIESDVNLSIVLKARDFMAFCGIPTVLTRDGKEAIYDEDAGTIREKKVSDLRNRLKVASEYYNPLFISVHQNSSPNASHAGAQVFFAEQNPYSKELAGDIEKAFRAVVTGQRVRISAKVPKSVYIMKQLICPAVIIECAYISNKAEEALLADEGYQGRLAFAIACGVLVQGLWDDGSAE